MSTSPRRRRAGRLRRADDLRDHADAAVTAAVLIHRLVAERFGGELRIVSGSTTGVVIAGHRRRNHLDSL